MGLLHGWVSFELPQMKLHGQPFKLVSLNHRHHLSNELLLLNSELLHQTFMADLSSSHNKSHRALSLTLNLSSISLSSRPKLSLNLCSLISKTLSNELHGRPSQAHPLTLTSPPQAASPHQTLIEPSPNPSSLSLISKKLLGRASLELPRSPISNHQPPPLLHGGSSAFCVSA